MTVDLSKAKAGDRVKFRCGGEGVIPKEWNCGMFDCGTENIPKRKFPMWGSEEKMAMRWCQNGRACHWQETPFDIIEVIPKAFDWSEVKPGMCLRNTKHHFSAHYVGRDMNGQEVLHLIVDDVLIRDFVQSDYVRDQKHDIPMEAGE